LNVDFVIYMSGCAANCALKYSSSNASSVVVAAVTVDAIVIDETELVTEIVTQVKKHFGDDGK